MPANAENGSRDFVPRGVRRVLDVLGDHLLEKSQGEKRMEAEQYRARFLERAPAFIESNDLLTKFGLSRESEADQGLIGFLEGSVAAHLLFEEQCPPRPSESPIRRFLQAAASEHKDNLVTVRTAIDIQTGLNESAETAFGSGDSGKAQAINEYFTDLNRDALMHGRHR